MNRSFCSLSLATTSLLALASGVAHAQSSPTTCEEVAFNDLLVSVNGRATTVESGPSGVLVNGAFCGWWDEIRMIRVVGGDLDDRVTFRGSFIPGNQAEPDWDELEVDAQLGGGTDTVILELGNNNDWVTVGYVSDPAGVNLNADSDDDFFVHEVEIFKLYTMGGNDTVLGANSLIPLYLYGGDGNDVLLGSNFADVIDGEAGNDDMRGNFGDDLLIGGPGSDIYTGGTGNDTADYRAKTAAVTVTIGNGVADDGEAGELDDVQADVEVVLGGKGNDILIGSAANETLEGGIGNDVLDGGLGGDVLIGGPGNDTVDYSSRTGDLIVTIGNGSSDDGESGLPGEQDNVNATVENVTGGSGNDTLIGGTGANVLRGGPGNDTLQGDAGNDKLYGDAGDDTLQGDAGNDKLYGADGSDVLDGGADLDSYTAGAGNDFLYNDDGVAETVNCGPGSDDAEVDSGATDTFIGCEL